MWSLFKDKNEINEKNIIGFASFIVMVLFAVADLLTSLVADKDLIINEVVYNSFVWVTLGCFGISSFEKVKGKYIDMHGERDFSEHNIHARKTEGTIAQQDALRKANKKNK